MAKLANLHPERSDNWDFTSHLQSSVAADLVRSTENIERQGIEALKRLVSELA